MTSDNHRTIIAIIPAYNEAGTVADIIRRTLPHVSKVIVVDDASTDATAQVARTAGATVYQEPINRGYNSVLNTGFTLAKQMDADIIITIDADGEHRPEDIPNMLEPIRAGRADLTVGARSSFPQLAEYIYSFYSRLRFGIIDPLCGFKAYTRKVIEQSERFDTRRSAGTEMTFTAIHRGFRAQNVPIPFLIRQNDTSRYYSRRFYGNIKILRAMFSIMFATLGPRKSKNG